MASRAGDTKLPFRLSPWPKLLYFVFIFISLKAKSKDLADLVNTPKPLNIELNALFAIANVRFSFFPTECARDVYQIRP